MFLTFDLSQSQTFHLKLRVSNYVVYNKALHPLLSIYKEGKSIVWRIS